MRRRRLIGLGATALAIGALGAGDRAGAQDGGVDQSTLDELTALVPLDADELTDDEAGALIEQMLAIAGSIPTASGDDTSKLTGPCGGFAYSYDGEGALIDAAYDAGDDNPPQDLIDGGQAFTRSNRFLIDTGGRVTYFGFAPLSGPGPQDHEYSLEVAGITVASGGDPNTNEKNRNAGTIDIGEEMPFELSLAFEAGGTLQAPGFPGCAGQGHVELDGNGLASPVGVVGLTLTALGLIGLFFARPARTWRQ